MSQNSIFQFTYLCPKSFFELKRAVLLFFAIGMSLSGFSQLPNRVFYDRESINSADSNRWQLSLRSLGFTKNNEYFNPMIDGYSLFGIQLNPNVTYTLSENFRLDAGIFIRQDFGAPGFQEIIPTFTFRTNYKNVEILFGALDGSLNHGLIEPLFDFERVLLDRVEQGVQFRFNNNRIDLDMWMDWEKMIYRGDPEQEEVYGGIRLNYGLSETDYSRWKIPFQFILFHRGGSIDSNPNPIKTAMNLAIGLEWTNGKNEFPGKWELSGYYLYYRDWNFNGTLLYKDGNAYYLNVMRHLRHGLKIMVSAWRGNEFITLLGGKIYPSVSSNFKSPYTVDPQRTLLILRIMHDIDIGNGMVLTTRFEPFYDFSFEKFDFNHGLYFNFRKRFDLSRR